MFYETTIKAVTNGGAVDVNGRSLQFIGYLPVKAGDTVFTDGRFIFGNAPPKGAPAIFETPSGIPVLSDELRGYVNNRGTFKSYSIAQDDWITNSKKNFAHGEEKFNGEKVIDAETNDEGDIFIVTDGFFRKCQTVKYNNHLYNLLMRRAVEKNSAGEITFESDHQFIYDVAPIVGQQVTLGANAADIDKPVTIYKNDEKFIEIPLGAYAQMAVAECYRCNAELLAQSADISTPPAPVNFIQQPPPPSDSFIALAYSRVETFHVDQNGDWDAIVSAAAYGHCFLYILLNGSLFHQLFADATLRNFSRSLDVTLELFETTVFDEAHYPFLSFEKYPSFTGTKKDADGNYTDDYKQYTVDKLEYYIPLVRFSHYKWEPFIFSSYFLFHVHNGEIVTTIISSSGGGNEFEVTESWDEVNQYGDYAAPSSSIRTPARPYIEADGEELTEKNEWDFPLGDDYFLHGEGCYFIDVRKDNETLFPIGGDDYGKLIPHYPMPLLTQFDEVALSAGDDLSYFNHIYIPIFTYDGNENMLNFYLQDDDDREIYSPLWVHFNGDNKGFCRFNFSFTELKNNAVLFGTHGDKLIRYNNDGYSRLGDGLKNFRLRELKKISKAKK